MSLTTFASTNNGAATKSKSCLHEREDDLSMMSLSVEVVRRRNGMNEEPELAPSHLYAQEQQRATGAVKNELGRAQEHGLLLPPDRPHQSRATTAHFSRNVSDLCHVTPGFTCFRQGIRQCHAFNPRLPHLPPPPVGARSPIPA